MSIDLDKIDILRERGKVTYKEAREALEAAGGDIVEALVYLEEKIKSGVREGNHIEIMNRAKGLAQKGLTTNIEIRSETKKVAEIPAPLGVLGAVFLPKVSALGVVLLLLSRYSLKLGQGDE